MISSEKSNRKNQYSLVLLAGGKSSRMGENKAKLTYAGETFTKTLILKAKNLGIEQILLSGFEEKEESVQVVWDIYSERGPLGGIHACMKQMKTPYCLVLPVDVPQIPEEVLEELLLFHEQMIMAEKKVPVLLKHHERRENLIGIYPVEMVDYIEELIKEHPTSVHRMLDTWGNCCYEADMLEWQAANINTQENYQELLSMDQN